MALRARLLERITAPRLSALAFGYGVVLPQTTFDVASVEWPAEAVVDRPHLADSQALGRWLRRLTEYWWQHTGVRAEAPAELLAQVRDLLRPEFERVPSLAWRVDAVVALMDRLTDDQYRQLDLIEANPRILIDGGAGTGKTFLAVEIAKRAATRGERVLVTTWSATLTAFLRSRLPPAVRVRRFDELEAGAEQCDRLVVDEAQDLLTFGDLGVLDAQVVGGLESGRWCLFYDQNNQSALRGHHDPDALAYLSSLGPALGALKWNCRNTRELATQTKLLTGADLGTSNAGAGPPVEFQYYESRDGCAAILAEHLSNLFANDVGLDQVTILSPLGFRDSAASCLPAKWLGRITELTPANVAAVPFPGLTFSTVERFKGLENRFICLIDIAAFDASPRDLSLMYVGMSRARAGLWVAIDRTLRGSVEAAARANLVKVLPERHDSQ
jgi:UvrD-like helicase C-terminal domain/AAA domain